MNFKAIFNSKKFIRTALLGALMLLSLNLILNDYQKTVSQNQYIQSEKISLEQEAEGEEYATQTNENQQVSELEEWVEIKKVLSKINPENEKQVTKKYCSEVPIKIRRRIEIKKVPDNFNALNSSIKNLDFIDGIQNGGKWSPKDCQARHKVAIVIPYKNRLKNLNYFLYHMHPFLQRQELEYQIFVVEQVNNELFNKGILMNSAFFEIRNLYNYTNSDLYFFPFDCIIYHDVDLLPEDDRILYSCPQAKPRHLSVAIDKFKYKIFYYRLIGGVLNFRIHHFVKVNGYSNQYWGWGGEDDDMEVRLSNMKIGFERPNINIAHYSMLKHDKGVANPLRKALLKKAETRFQKDGLNNVKYTLKSVVKHRMFTHFLIDVGHIPPEMIQNMTTTKTAKKNIQVKNAKLNKTTIKD